MTEPLPWAAPPPALDDDEALLHEVTLPGAGLSSLGGALVPGASERVLMSLFTLGRSGRLAVEAENGGPRGTLFFLRGDPVFAQPADAAARLLARLRAAGAVADEAVPDPERALVSVLTRRRWASPNAILRALRDEIREFTQAFLAADLGVYKFFDDVELADH